MPLTVIAVGKKHEDWVALGIERYQKRLRAPMNLEWILLPHSRFEGDRARLDESERIISRLDRDAYVVLLDERGSQYTSAALAAHISDLQSTAKQIVILIGGAYGVTEALRNRANLVWSLSSLVFPHQFVRLILAEQLYRVQQIQLGTSYHHE